MPTVIFYLIWNTVSQDYVRKGTPVYVQTGDYKGRGGPRIYTERHRADAIAKQSESFQVMEFLGRPIYHVMGYKAEGPVTEPNETWLMGPTGEGVR